MKNTSKSLLTALIGAAVLAFSACGSAPDKATSSVSTVSGSEVQEHSSVNEDVTTASTYYEEPTAPKNTGDAEGFIPDDIPEGKLTETEKEKACSFTEGGREAYSVTIDQVEFTDRRSQVPGMEAEKVLLITYTYQSLNGEPRLVDDMSFRLFQKETAIDPYYVSDQLMGDISTDSPVTAEVCFSVPADAKEFSLFIVDNAEEDNENYLIPLKM